MLKVTGLDKLSKSLDELQSAVSELGGEIGTVSFDPYDPGSIEQAIQAANRAIDEKVARYSHNKAVADLAENFKENARATILQRAAEARLKKDEE